MKFADFENIMKAANAANIIEGYITFSQTSFTQPYPRASRTYLVSSENKRWQANAISGSIWGSSLDGSDCGVKLSEYMVGENAWQIEDCGTVSYMLLSIYEREMCKACFSTLDAARAAMRKEFEDAVGVSSVEDYLETNDGAFDQYSAWANDCGSQDGNADWVICRLLNDGVTICLEDEFFCE